MKPHKRLPHGDGLQLFVNFSGPKVPKSYMQKIRETINTIRGIPLLNSADPKSGFIRLFPKYLGFAAFQKSQHYPRHFTRSSSGCAKSHASSPGEERDSGG